MDWTERATLVGSNMSTGEGLPVSIWQKSQRRVHSEPPIRKVASLSSQHSKMLGQPASSHTVWRPSFLTRFLSWTNSGPIWTLALIHSGFRSTGVAAFRCSMRSIFRPSGASVTVELLLGQGGVFPGNSMVRAWPRSRLLMNCAVLHLRIDNRPKSTRWSGLHTYG